DPGQDEVMHRIDVHGAQGVDFLKHAHGADLGGHGRANAAGDEDGHHHGGEFAREGVADDAANGTGQSAFGQERTGLQREHAANEQGQDAGHEQAGVADV